MESEKWGGVIIGPYCSNRCLFCGGRGKIPDSELKQQENNVFRNLIEFKGRGIKKVEISGGDPIEYSEIANLIKYIKKIGFEKVHLSTHGTRLSDEAFLDEIIHSGLDILRIPLYGSKAKIHDSVTQSKGSFRKTLKGIKGILEKSEIHIKISSLIVQQNKNDLTGITDLVGGLGIKDFYFSIPCLVGRKDLSYYIPLKDLGPYVKKAYDHSSKEGFGANFKEIPYCIFSKADRNRIENTSKPPDLGKYCQPPARLKTQVKDLPSYRVKAKTEMCKTCKCFDFCDGFFLNDITNFGTGNIKPILELESP
ncbi:MAG: radical SAM protein [Candidatus Diapherotrites archaeon]|nr:radical SAM protein [Candidatus Diapherotrites archaeon]